MESKTIKLKFRKVNQNIFEAIRNGRKTVETRAATVRYRGIKKGGCVIFISGKDRFEKRIVNAQIFQSIGSLLKKYKVKQINPDIETEKELRKMYYSFPGYREKIKKYGLVALEFTDG